MEVRRDSVNHDVIFDDEFKKAIQRHGEFATTYRNPAHPENPPGCEHFAETVAAYFLFDDAENAREVSNHCWASEDVRCEAPEKYEFSYDRYDFVKDAIASY